MKFGYARVSTREQHLEQQIDALMNYGVEHKNIYREHVSGQKSKRPQLDDLLDSLRTGDELVCWKLDRIGRNYIHLEQTIRGLDERGIKLVSLTEAVDTTTPSGKLFYRMMSIFNEFERDVIIERTLAGMARVKKSGKRIGRSYSDSPILMQRVIDAKLGGATPAQIKEQYKKAAKLSDQTIYRWSKEYRERKPELMAHLSKAKDSE